MKDSARGKRSVRESDRRTKDQVREFYEKQSAGKTADLEKWLNSGEARIPQPRTYYYFEDRKIANALEMARLPRGSKILEIGCNLGQMTFVLNQKGYSIVGTDISPGAIEKARTRTQRYRLSDITFEVQDAENIEGHPDGEFDAAFSFSTFRYLTDPEKALRECFRLVRTGGCAVIDFPNKFCPWFSLLKPAVFVKKHIHDHLFTASQVRDLMRRAGFVNVEIRRFLFAYKELPAALLPALKAVDYIFERLPLIRKTAAIIMAKGNKP